MLPEPPGGSDRSAARLAQALESVRPVHTALGAGLDMGWASDLLALYDKRPAWAVPGSISPADALFLGELIRAIKPRTILELGVAAGCSTSLMAWAAHRSAGGGPTRIIACDFAEQWYHDPSRPVGVAIAHMVGDDRPIRETIEIRTGVTSCALGEDIEPGTIDLAFIDADHRHPWPLVDLALVCPLVRPGGWIALHDTRLEVMARRHERKRGEPAPWSYRGPVIAFEAWPGERVHAATESANIAAVRVPETGADRARLMEALRAHPWETDLSDPQLRRAIAALEPRSSPITVAAHGSPRAPAPTESRVCVALVSREFPPAFGGGIGTACANIAAGLVAGGHRVHVVTAAEGASDCVTRRTLADGLVVHRVPVPRAGGDWWESRVDFSARCARVVDGLARDGEIDVVEFPECEAPGLVHALGQERAGPRIPTVVQLHTPTELLFGLRSAAYDGLCAGLWNAMAAERACIGLADVVYAPSRFIAAWSVDWWGLADTPSVVPYPHAPITSEVRPIDETSARTVVYIGRLEPRKGASLLASAWNRVIDRVPDARLIIAGADTSHAVTGGSVRRAMERALTPAGVAATLFTGPVPHAEVASLIDRGAVCVVPSLWENFPNVAMEAMARGRAIVASDRGGMAEMIGSTVGGTVFGSGDDAALARALESMLGETPAQLGERGRAARAAIQRVCDPIATTMARVEVYRAAIERNAIRNFSDRAQWVELGPRSLDATIGRGDAVGPRPIPGFGLEVMRWVHPARPRIAVA